MAQKKRPSKKQPQKKPRRDIYQEITDRVLEILDRGTVPWHNPIRGGSGDGWPKNFTSRKRYRGINTFLLTFQSWDKGYSSDHWLTYRQATEQGGQIRKGEKASLVTFWKLYEKTDQKTGDEVKLPVLKHYNVFNVDQCEGIENPDENKSEPIVFKPIEQAEKIVSGYSDPPIIMQSGHRAVYRPLVDTVLIAPPAEFESAESYYATLNHEIIHSTGHEKRLKRGLDTDPAPFGSPDYSKEELIAEMGAAFLNATAGISAPTIEQSSAYIEHWQKALKGDKRLVVSAAGAAQKAADWILGTTFEDAVASKPVTETQEKPTMTNLPSPTAQTPEPSHAHLDCL